MLFNSWEFLLFFPTVVTLYFLSPHKWRWFLLLIVSCIFYMLFIPVYILILLATILIDYAAGILIEKTEEKTKKKIYLIVSIISTCAVLFIFKYFNFFNVNFVAIAQFFDWNYSITALKIILPIGLSFHTFQSLSYVIEVYRKNQKAEYNFGIYSLYVMFFPQLVAGPIERPQNLLHQFYERHIFDYKRIIDGLSLMLWGFFKKIVIADNVAGLVNIVYNNPENFTGVHFIIATILFAFQIFCDFSGYSDIAIGAAKVLGFDLMKNFDRPYSAKSISEFWRRWHISLSTWFRDYLYIPLGGSRAGKFKKYLNLMIVFMASGIWHGANWTFIVWGFIHGLYLVIGELTKVIRGKAINYLKIDKLPRVYGLVQTSVAFLLVCFAWIFFRANSLYDAWYITANLFVGIPDFLFNLTNLNSIKSVLGKFAVSPMEFIRIWIFIASLIIVYAYKGSKSIQQALTNKPTFVRWGFYYILIMVILFFGNLGKQPFIYFQF